MTSSTAKITHIAGSGSGFADKFTTFRPGPSSSMLLWSNTFGTPGAGNHFSIGAGGLGSVSNPTTATFAIKSGTGVGQQDPPGGAVWAASQLKLEFEGKWRTTSTPNPAFGPIATAYFSMAYTGVNTGAGVNPMSLTLNYYLGTSTTPFRTVTKVDSVAFTGSPQPTRTFTSSYAFPGGSVAPNTDIRVKGVITFSANNDNAPAFVDPLNMDFGSAPPTANWQPDAGGDWTAAANWAPLAGTFEGDSVLTTMPNGVGERARFANLNTISTTPVPRTVNVNTAVTLGTLHIDADDPYTFAPAAGGSLRLEVQQGEAVIENGVSDGGGGDDVISTPISLGSSVVVKTEGEIEPEARGGLLGTANLIIDSQISGTGANTQGLTKLGEASLSLNVTNLYGGGTGARGGYLDANVSGSLGTGTVLADDGQLNYNALQAAAPGIISTAQHNGQINLGVVTGIDFFALNDLGAVSGSATELGTLNVLVGGNLTIQPGAMVAHETFDPLETGNPIGLFAAVGPTYVFGIAEDITTTAPATFTVGSNSFTIWRGFGGDRGVRVYGNDRNSGTQTLVAAGTTELVSLHNSVTINARLTNSGASALIKRGGGTVIINNVTNPFVGHVTVQSGTLAIAGSLVNLTGMQVDAAGALAVRPGGTLGVPTINLSGGQVHISGGTTQTNQLIIGSGEIHVTGGTLSTVGELNVNTNTLAQFSGGNTIIGANMPTSGTVHVNGGNVNVLGSFTGNISGTLRVESGTFNVTGSSTVPGRAFFEGGAASFGGNVSVPNTSFETQYNGGTLRIGGTLSVANGGSFLIGAGTQRLLRVGGVVTPFGGRVDLNDSDMVATATNYNAIRSRIASARAGGNWTGEGITSTAAKNAVPAATTLGVLTGAQYQSLGLTTFNGHTVAASDVLVKYTYYGDSDFSGDVNFDDYARTDAGFNTGGNEWFEGDFDLNNTVNFDDYALLDLAFNVQSGTLRQTLAVLGGKTGSDDFSGMPAVQKVVDHYEQFGDVYAQSFLSAVPEPASGALSALIGAAVLRRRRK